MEEHNRDVFPTVDVLKLYAPIGAVIENEIVDVPFSRHDAAAKHAKRVYHLLGRLGIILVVLSAVFTVAEGFVFSTFVGATVIRLLMIILGCCGIGIQLYLVATQRKKRWLLHRFAAERLRSIKFQAYPLSQVASNSAGFIHEVEEFYVTETARLNMELNAGLAAFALFSPGLAVRRISAPQVEVRTPLYAASRAAYRELRIEYQRRFATAEIQKFQMGQRIGYTAADILYVAGAALTVATLLAQTLFGADESTANWLEFLAVAAFIVGLSKTILDNASLAETSRSRYENYVEMIEECDAELKEEKADFAEIVRRFERVVLEELSQFCQAASKISYRL